MKSKRELKYKMAFITLFKNVFNLEDLKKYIKQKKGQFLAHTDCECSSVFISNTSFFSLNKNIKIFGFIL